MKNTRNKRLETFRFSTLELVAAMGILTLVMAMTFSLISVTRHTHARAQQQTRAILVLNNVVEELQCLEIIDVDRVRACVTREFHMAEIARKHELKVVVEEKKNGVHVTIWNKARQRRLASMRLPYEE